VCGRSSDKAFEQAVRRLRAARSVLTVTHVRPDGDAVGSMVALTLAARRAGKVARMLVPDAVPAKYEFLLAGRERADAGRFSALADQAEVIVIVDTCTYSQLGELGEHLPARRDKIVVIDHHATRDDIGAVQWVDSSAAAAAVMVALLLKALHWPVDAPTAEALMTALTTDTGWLRFSNTNPRCLRMFADWMEAGVRVDELYNRIYQSDRPQRLKLMARALQSLELHCDDRLAVMALSAADFAETGARPDETENIVNEAMRLGRVSVAVLVIEQPSRIRANLRSRGEVDVALIAKRFGGGGHSCAAGCSVSDDLETGKQRLTEACAEALKGR